MKRKNLISIVILVIMLLNCILPIFSVYAVDSNIQSITLNSELYTAVVNSITKENYTGFTYNDLLRTITASNSDFNSVETLILKESKIDDISGLEVFTGLKKLDLSGNYLDLDSNLEIINGFSSLKSLDLSTNRIDGFSWLTSNNLDYTNFQRQSIEKVKIISVESEYTDEEDDEGNPIRKDDLPEKIVETTEGLLSEFNLESIDLDVNTYTTQGKIWNSEGKTNGVQEGRAEVGSNKIDYEENTIILKDMYNLKNNNQMYNITAKVINSKNKYFDSLVDLYYIIVDENEEGIVFKDENFYKAVKKQLSFESNDNAGYKEDLIYSHDYSYNGNGLYYLLSNDTEFELFNKLFNENDITNLSWKDITNDSTYPIPRVEYSEIRSGNYLLKITRRGGNGPSGTSYSIEFVKTTPIGSAAYDKALTLIIDKDVILNYIPVLVADNEKVQDLTGLEKFVGLKENFSATYNYIVSIEKVIELEENKVKMENEVRQKISEQITKISTAKAGWSSEETVSYIGIIKDYLDNKESIEKQLIDLRTKENKTEDDEKRISELEFLLANLDSTNANRAMQKINKIFKKIYKIWNKSEDIATIQTPDLYVLENTSLLQDKEVAKSYLTSELEKLKTLEENGLLDSNIASEIVKAFPSSFGTSDSSSENSGIETIEMLWKFNNEEDINKLSIDNIKEILNRIKSLDNNENILTKEYTDLEECYKVAGRLIQNNTNEMLSVIIKLPRLKTLNLDVNNIESLEKIDNLTSIETLSIKENLITTIDNVDWTKLEELKVLELAKNQISNIDKLNELSPHLETLDVSDCLLAGEFNFDFVKMNIKNVDFSGNYYNNLSKFVKSYYEKAKRADASSIVEYLNNEGYTFNFARQTVNVDGGNVNPKDNETITFILPSIFADIEQMDPYNTTFGVVPGDGSVEEYGNTVTFAKYNNGLNTGTVTVESVENGTNNRNKDSIGLGTTCYIKYTVGNSSSEVVDPTPTDPVNPSEPIDPNPSTPTDPSTGSGINGSKEATSENVAMDEYSENKDLFIYVYEPDVTVASLAKLFEYTSPENATGNRTSRSVVSVNGKTDLANDLSRVFTTETITINFKSYNLDTSTLERDENITYEIVVLGDIDGDGDIDSIDSGYARALKYDTLYNDISDKEERIELMNAFKQTANYKAADMNLDEKITTDETAVILYYRAGLLDSFKTFNK